jgi:polyhydroxybutyrate depolymerase
MIFGVREVLVWVTGSARLRAALKVALGTAVTWAMVSVVSLTGTQLPAGASTTPSCTNPDTTTTLSLSIGGFTRTVIVHEPASTSKTKRALVLNLHGSGATALDQELFSGMNYTSDADGFIVAYPQGLIPDGTGFDWNVPGVPLTGGRAVPDGSANDVKFLTKLVGVLESKYCINKNEVYATGFSGGARETSQLACDESGVFAAVAPISGLRRPTPCPTTRAVPVIAFHGSNDEVDPFAGHGEAYWTYSVSTAAKDWAKQDHCSKKATSTTPATNVKLTSYAGCASGAAVELYEVMGEGHEWPGGPVMPSSITSELGPQSSAIDANAVMWSFFEAHPLAG